MFRVPIFCQHAARSGSVQVPGPFARFFSELGAAQYYTARVANDGASVDSISPSDYYAGQVVDGTVLELGDIVLNFNNGGAYEGIWEVGEFGSRPVDADELSELVAKPYVYVSEGTYAGQWFRLDTRFVDTIDLIYYFQLPGTGPESGISYPAYPQIASWQDQSGHAHHVTQATENKQPQWVPDQLNGYPAIRFDGVNDFLSSSAFTALPTGTLILVYKLNATTNGQYMIGTGALAADNAPDIHIAGGKVRSFAGVASLDGAAPDTGAYILIATFAGDGTSLLQIAGVDYGPLDIGNVPLVRLTFGADDPTGASPASVDLFAVEPYDIVLTSPQRAARYAFLRNKYFPTVAVESSDLRVTEDGTTRVTEDGTERVIE